MTLICGHAVTVKNQVTIRTVRTTEAVELYITLLPMRVYTQLPAAVIKDHIPQIETVLAQVITSG